MVCFLCACHMFMHAGGNWCCLCTCYRFMHVGEGVMKIGVLACLHVTFSCHVGVSDGIGVLIVCICDLHLRMCVHVLVYLRLGPGGE